MSMIIKFNSLGPSGTHHIALHNFAVNVSGNGCLFPVWCQAITWAIADLYYQRKEKKLSKILIEI